MYEETSLESAYGFKAICAELSERFGTAFELWNSGGGCMLLVADVEGGEIRVSDWEDTLSPVEWHLDGRAGGFAASFNAVELEEDGAYTDWPNEIASAWNEHAKPNADDIGAIICAVMDAAAKQRAGIDVTNSGPNAAGVHFQTSNDGMI